MLELSDVHTYYGDSHILRGISMTVEEGEIVGLLGRNGAGKTTTLRSITGIQPPREGTVHFEGADITGTDITDISTAGIKLVPEDRRPFSGLTVEENLQLSVDHTYGDDWTLDRVFSEFPVLEERTEQLAGQLSGGEQQMLVIAQALLGNPKIILLDEPMEGLAPQIIEQIADIIQFISEEGIPILLVEQQLTTCLRLMDRGYLLHKGEIQMSGSTEEFRSSEDTVQKYLSVSV